MDIVSSERSLRVWLWISLICNMGIVVTGAVVRLTGSGLGCTDWPECTPGKLVPHGELGIRGAIEFGNRTLSGVLILAALGALIAAYRVRGRSSRVFKLMLLVLAGIITQAVVGGITVWVKLHPSFVAIHLVLSIVLIVISVWALLDATETHRSMVSAKPFGFVVATFVASMAAIVTGTLTTGAGPHSGDSESARNGLNIESIARIHSLSAWLIVFLAVTSFILLRKVSESSARVALIFLITVISQGAIGYLQYFLGIPAEVVWLHIVGLTILTAAAAWLLYVVRLQRAS